jgi:hypothetical protein
MYPAMILEMAVEGSSEKRIPMKVSTRVKLGGLESAASDAVPTLCDLRTLQGPMRALAVRPAAVLVLFAGLCAASAVVAARQTEPGRLPPSFADYLNRVAKMPAADQAKLGQGLPVTRLLDADPSTEVAIFGAVWVNAPIKRYVAAVKDIEDFEKGDNFLVTKKISSPPQLEDFAQLTLPQEDFEDLRSCKAGSCEVKLGQAALSRLQREVDWSRPGAKADVDRTMRALALDYVKAYLEGGNARLAEYRDSDRPRFIGREFESMVDRMPSLGVYLPDIKRYLVGFPKVLLPASTSFLYWQEARFGLKPTIRINHVTIVEQPERTVVTSKILYASHYFWTALELRVLAPDPSRGEGFWFASVNRSRSDGLSGFVGSLLRGKVRGEVEKGMEASLRATKTMLEDRTLATAK